MMNSDSPVPPQSRHHTWASIPGSCSQPGVHLQRPSRRWLTGGHGHSRLLRNPDPLLGLLWQGPRATKGGSSSAQSHPGRGHSQHPGSSSPCGHHTLPSLLAAPGGPALKRVLTRTEGPLPQEKPRTPAAQVLPGDEDALPILTPSREPTFTLCSCNKVPETLYFIKTREYPHPGEAPGCGTGSWGNRKGTCGSRGPRMGAAQEEPTNHTQTTVLWPSLANL